MRFFARFTILCNICFIISVVMRLVNMADKEYNQQQVNGAVKLNPFVSSVVVLGWIAIFINLCFVILFASRYASKKMNGIPRWIVFANLILLPAQIYYYFFSKF